MKNNFNSIKKKDRLNSNPDNNNVDMKLTRK